MTTIILDKIDVSMLVSGNRRIHWARRANVQRYWRYLVLARMLADGTRVKHDRAHVTITVRFPNNRKRDVHNLLPLVGKPLVDGLVDAGVIPDDDDKHLIGPDMRRDPDNGTHRVVVEIVAVTR